LGVAPWDSKKWKFSAENTDQFEDQIGNCESSDPDLGESSF
jgi:hypothetical protein